MIRKSIISSLVFLCLLTSWEFAEAQVDSIPDFPADSTINLFDLNEEEFELQSEPIPVYKISSGWLPSVSGTGWNWEYHFMFGANWDVTRNIRPSGFAETEKPFSGEDNLTEEERTIYKKKSDLFYATYPTSSYSNMGIRLLGPLFYNLLFSVDLSYYESNGVLFTNRSKKHYLNNIGVLKTIKEASIANLWEKGINNELNILLPVWGSVMTFDSTALASYYYISGGVSSEFALWHEFTQYTQMLSPKTKIRYSNLRDTVRMISEKELKNFNPWKFHGNLSIGMLTHFSVVGFGLEIFAKIPINSVITDEKWEQYRFGVRLFMTF